ncbi:hypothetical protein H2248_003802 [Termitomyces sp. 'cryptogamus']|nr:hypothetical protein H2248_003802 [Termitomyces sp. 'cryptogamus']
MRLVSVNTPQPLRPFIGFRQNYKPGLIALFTVLTCVLLWFIWPSPISVSPFEPGIGPFNEDGFNDSALGLSRTSEGNISKWERRQDEVRRAFMHAYSGYMEHAFPADELLATSGGKSSKFNGWSITLIDAMDTMWMMGLENQFIDAVQVVAAQNFTTNSKYFVSFFETVIRYLGGLLSAYSLSGEPILLSRADDLGTFLLPIFETPSGFPINSGNVRNMDWMGKDILFSEAASCQLEFKYLAKLTGRKEYYRTVDRIMERLYATKTENGLFPTRWSGLGEPLDRQYTVGASGDSGYEYLLKQYLLSGDTKALTQYLESINGVMQWLLFVTPTRELLYVASMNHLTVKHDLEHLACFLPGLLALGAHTIPDAYLPAKERERHKWAAAGLAYTCYLLYADQKSGLGPEKVGMKPGTRWVDELATWEAAGRVGMPPGLKEEGPIKNQKKKDYDLNGGGTYFLRPETVESLYIMWRTTGEEKWRERGYEIFVAIERHAKTRYGYTSVAHVDMDPVRPLDEMPSFFLAETLKYLFLLFDEEDRYPFSKWVFNTEAHPLPVFKWSSWERKLYRIIPELDGVQTT